MKYFVTLPDGRELEALVVRDASGGTRVTVGGRTFEADAVLASGATSVRLDDEMIDLWLEGSVPDVGVATSSLRFYARVESERMRALGSAAGRAAQGEGIVTSPMPGRVVRLLVEPGQRVEAGAAVVVVEAMKMENELAAARSGEVVAVFVRAGDTVDGGTKLVEIGGEPSS